MAEGVLRLPGSSYAELTNTIVAYGTRDRAAGSGDVSKLDGVHRTSASRTNGFLVDIGVLRGEREKLVTGRGRELALALQKRDQAKVREIWRQVVSTSEFLQNVVSAVKIREGMPRANVQAYIAHAAGQPRNKPVMAGSETVIEILKNARLLREDAEGNVSSASEDEPPESEGADEPLSEADFYLPEEEVSPGETSSPTVNIHLHVRCDADDLDLLAPKLRALIRDLRREPGVSTRPRNSSGREDSARP